MYFVVAVLCVVITTNTNMSGRGKNGSSKSKKDEKKATDEEDVAEDQEEEVEEEEEDTESVAHKLAEAEATLKALESKMAARDIRFTNILNDNTRQIEALEKLTSQQRSELGQLQGELAAAVSEARTVCDRLDQVEDSTKNFQQDPNSTRLSSVFPVLNSFYGEDLSKLPQLGTESQSYIKKGHESEYLSDAKLVASVLKTMAVLMANIADYDKSVQGKNVHSVITDIALGKEASPEGYIEIFSRVASRLDDIHTSAGASSTDHSCEALMAGLLREHVARVDTLARATPFSHLKRYLMEYWRKLIESFTDHKAMQLWAVQRATNRSDKLQESDTLNFGLLANRPFDPDERKNQLGAGKYAPEPKIASAKAGLPPVVKQALRGVGKVTKALAAVNNPTISDAVTLTLVNAASSWAANMANAVNRGGSDE